MDATISPSRSLKSIAPGLFVAIIGVLLAWGINALLPAIPLLTVCVVLGIAVGQIRALQAAVDGPWAVGLTFSAKTLMRVGIVLLGLKLSLTDIAGLGIVGILTTIGVVVLAFFGTLLLGRVMNLPGRLPLLIATGFAICGASAIGAMSGVIRAKKEETATAVALVTLCGTLAIAILPLLWHPLGMTDVQFGHWVGAGVHDVGQVVATASIAGSAALAIAVVVKLTRVLLLAPIVGITAIRERRRSVEAGGDDAQPVVRPPLLPLFVAGFIVAVLVRSFVPVPEGLLAAADGLQTIALALALFSLGSAVHLRSLFITGWRALVVGLLAWALIAALAFGAVQL